MGNADASCACFGGTSPHVAEGKRPKVVVVTRLYSLGIGNHCSGLSGRLLIAAGIEGMIPAAAGRSAAALWSAETQVAVVRAAAGLPRAVRGRRPVPLRHPDGCFPRVWPHLRPPNPPRLMVGDGTPQVVNISLADYTVHAIDTAAPRVSRAEQRGPAHGASSRRGARHPYVVPDMFNELIVTGATPRSTRGGAETSSRGCSPSAPNARDGSVRASRHRRAGAPASAARDAIPIGRPPRRAIKFWRSPREVEKGAQSGAHRRAGLVQWRRR